MVIQRKAWALVSRDRKIDIESVRSSKKEVKDGMTIYDTETKAKPRRVMISVID